MKTTTLLFVSIVLIAPGLVRATERPGLLLNVFVALFLVPVLYTWFARRSTPAP